MLLGQEIEALRKEAQAFKAVRLALRTPSPNGSSDVAKTVFDKVRLHMNQHP